LKQGFRKPIAILLLYSRNSIESGWRRADYEPLLSEEIRAGRTHILALKLDDCEIPPLDRPDYPFRIGVYSNFVDLRPGLTGEASDWDNSSKLSDYSRLLAQLDAYKRQLREALSRLTNA
jgi:hypothetical protein